MQCKRSVSKRWPRKAYPGAEWAARHSRLVQGKIYLCNRCSADGTAVGRVEVWADGAEAIQAEVYAHGAAVGRAEVWVEGVKASKAEVWVDGAEASKAEV